MMLRTEFCVRNFQFQISKFGCSSDHQHQSTTSFVPHSLIFPNKYYPCRFSLRYITPKKCHKSGFISCKDHSFGKFRPKSYNYQPDDDEFVEASLLISETVKHYHLRKQGFREEVKKLAGQVVPFSTQVKYLKNDVNSIGLSVLRRFRQPTIFLKISCEGDYLLPIVVGEFAVEKLIDSLNEDDHGGYPNQFQFVRNIMDGLGSEVRMVKVTERALNTYIARVYFGKVEERGTFSVDARPSDAINVAQRCQAPIYVNKHIVLTDAIRISYGTGRVCDTNPIYDVLLDSPMDGPDLLVEEFNLVQKMKLAAKEERYNDAAMWRDEILKLCNSATQTPGPIKSKEISIPELP